MLTTSIAHGKTGTAPGTTVLTIPSGGSLGAVPNDFQVSKAHLNYQRFYHGWVPGYLSGAPLDTSDPQAVASAMAELEVYRSKLAAEKEVAEVAYTKSSRTWMIVGGVVGVLTLAVSVYALSRKSR